jgi:hypothetical protein
MEAVRTEALADPNAATPVALEGKTVHVLPVKKWKASAIRAMRQSDFDTWAEKCLAEGDYAVWQQVDPDVEQVEAFFLAWNKATGQDSGK